MRGILVAIGVLAASVADAQTKPIGLYDCGANPPAWVSVCTIADTEPDTHFVAARQMSERRGTLWLLQLGYHEPVAVHLGAHAARVRARLDASGLWPHVAAVAVGEEWYEHLHAGTFTPLGYPPHHPGGPEAVYAWLSVQHAAVRATVGRPIAWITTAVTPGRRVPLFTDVVGLDAYPLDGQPFGAAVGPALLAAERHTALPLFVIPRWFRTSGPAQGLGWSWMSAPPSRETLEGYAQILARPRWIAMVGFTGRSRPWADLVGLMDMPATLAAVEQIVRGQ